MAAIPCFTGSDGHIAGKGPQRRQFLFLIRSRFNQQVYVKLGVEWLM